MRFLFCTLRERTERQYSRMGGSGNICPLGEVVTEYTFVITMSSSLIDGKTLRSYSCEHVVSIQAMECAMG